MPLIDRTYFEGTELNLAKTDKIEVQEPLDSLIQKREPELLKALLGIDLYRAFMAGIVIEPMDVKWSNLLLGCDYTDRYGRTQEWRGFVSAPPALVDATNQANEIDYVAIQDDVDSQTIPVPPTMVGRSWRISKRPIGQLRIDEYDTSDDGDFVSFTTPIALSDTYFFYASNLSLEQSTGNVKQSLIANYVYYWYMRMNASQTTPLGEVASKAENSDINGPAVKMCRAWNEMVEVIEGLVCFLNDNSTVYTDWRRAHMYTIKHEFNYIPRF